jgi:crotonobetainyl-CoA:carnitine CoA-transferase CaiB-like acyl-CoA transferase
VRHRDAIVIEMKRLLGQRSTTEWLDQLGPIGVPCGPINDMAQTFAHPQVVHRNMKLEMVHPSSGTVQLIANPIRFREHPIEYDLPPPVLGQHSVDVLSGLLGFDAAQIASLREAGIV